MLREVAFLYMAMVIRSAAQTSMEEPSEKEIELTTRKTTRRTYFFQLRKDDTGSDVIYKHLTKDELGEKGNEEGEFIVAENRSKTKHSAFESLKNRRREFLKMERMRHMLNMNLLDDEWHYNVHNKHLMVPEITTELFKSIEDDAQSLRNVSVIRFLFETRPLTENILKFNFDCLRNKSDEMIVDVELHIYRSSDNNGTDEDRYSSDQVIRLYQILSLNETEENSTHNPDVHKLLNVIYVSSQHSGWQIFKVKNVLENWLQGNENLGFLLSATDSWENLVPLDIGRKYNGIYQPVLIIYLNKNRRRDTTSAILKPDTKRMEKYINSMKSNFLPNNPTPCARHIWYVSFQELGWNNFIISPSGFMAFKCKGSCTSKFISPFTHHGLLTNAYHNSISNLKSPCCVPDMYKALPIMFYDGYQNVVIKIYEDIIVNTCACR